LDNKQTFSCITVIYNFCYYFHFVIEILVGWYLHITILIIKQTILIVVAYN